MGHVDASTGHMHTWIRYKIPIIGGDIYRNVYTSWKRYWWQCLWSLCFGGCPRDVRRIRARSAILPVLGGLTFYVVKTHVICM